ncbi:transposase [Lactobacillus sp. ZJLC29-4]|uniref:Transposase n=1 Tax=Levilactobacillus tujiorum TaxID=2912243 RepID=A0ABX1L5I3_9LACO|nr:transposase [Lactobacillus sp. HBUAS51387]NLR30313.1 transposase [Levilactobacillus tujiorum]
MLYKRLKHDKLHWPCKREEVKKLSQQQIF